MTTEVVKRKCKSLFVEKDKSTILDTVNAVHDIISEASLLLKAFYLEWFESNCKDRCDDNKPFTIDKDILGICCIVCQGIAKFQTRTMSEKTKEKKLVEYNGLCEKDRAKKDKQNTKNKTRKEEIRTYRPMVLECFQRIFPNKENTKYKDLSLSHILAYSMETLVTNYKTNVVSHYPKYVKKYIYCKLLKLMQSPSLPKKTKVPDPVERIEGCKRIKKLAGKITSHVLFGMELNEVVPIDVGTLIEECVPEILVRNKEGELICRTSDLDMRPWVYLQRMVWINRMLENEEFRIINPSLRTLYNPLCLVSTFIPGSIRLDTSGVAQLLMDKDRIAEFVILYKAEYGITLDMKNKGDLLSSYEKLTNKENVPDIEKAQYATSLWKFICKFDNHKEVLQTTRKNGDVWVFDNSIVTDGYSVSFQITKIENLKRKIKFKKMTPEAIEKKIKEKKDKQDKHPEFKSINDSETETWWNSLQDKNNYRLLADDPGKRDIAFITDGIRCLRYTKGMRDQATYKKIRETESLKLRRNSKLKKLSDDEDYPSVSVYETEVLSKTCKKTCIFTKFVEYWKCRSVLKERQTVYNKAYFRQMKFLVYCKTKSSEMKFFDAIKKTFLPATQKKANRWMNIEPSPHCESVIKDKLKKACETCVIGWGNWGRNPNLKGNAPTPGIGFRRRAAKYFETITIPEDYTSQTCPCCKERRFEHPVVGEKYATEKHHLLRCTNDACKCRWWNRNVVGSYNILRRFVDGMLLSDGKPGQPRDRT